LLKVDIELEILWQLRTPAEEMNNSTRECLANTGYNDKIDAHLAIKTDSANGSSAIGTHITIRHWPLDGVLL